jgi:NH3-dependent NAD+ synthetase
MARLKKNDINEILELFENELNSLRNIDRIEKMKMKSRIRKQATWLLAFRNPKSLIITTKLEEKLSDLFRLSPYGFKDKLKDLLKKKTADIS